MSTLEAVAVAVSAFGLWLLARRSVWSWPVSLLGVALYSWIFLQAKLYSDMLLQGFFAASSVYGWVQWKEAQSHEGMVVVATPTRRETWLGIGAGAVGALALGSAMARYTDAAAPWLDSTLTSFSLIAQIWTARRFIQSWWLWIGLDVVYVGLFVSKGLNLTAGLYLVFIVLCFYGLADWRRATRRAPAPMPEVTTA